MNLSEKAIILAVLAGIAQYFQASMLITTRPEVKGEGSKDEDMAAIMNKQMKYMMPIMTIVIGVGLPGGLTLYWLVMTLATLAQQYFIFRKKPETQIVK